MPVEYDFQKYKPLIKEYVRALRPVCDSGGNFQCLNPAHDDGTMPSQWSMCWGKQPNTLHCYGCGTGGHDWDIYDLVGAIEGITEKGAQYRRVAEIAGDVVGSAEKWVCPPSPAPEPEFVPATEAIEKVYQWLKEIRPKYVHQIDAFSAFRGHSAEWGKRLAWWPGLRVARESLPEETLVSSGMVDPAKPSDKAAFNAEGAIVKLGRGFKLHYAGRPEEDGHIPTVKRGSRGCHTFPFPALPEGDTVVLVEGELDAVSGRMAGIPAVSIGGTNGLGTDRIMGIGGYNRIVLCFDNDIAGYRAIPVNVKKIRDSGYAGSILSVDWSRPECTGEKDIDDMVKHGKSAVVVKMIEEAKEVEDGGIRDRGKVEAEQARGAGDCYTRKEHDGSRENAGTANHGNDQRHESPDRGNAGNAEEGGVNGCGRGMDRRDQTQNSTQGKTDRETQGNLDANTGTGKQEERNAEEGGVPTPSDNEGGPRPTKERSEHTSISIAADLHDEDGRITPADIPFQFLGFDEGAYYFMPKQQNVAKRVGCTETAIKQMIYDLAPESWWLTYFYKTNKEGMEYVDTTAAIEWLRTCSTRKGMFNNEKLLGTGVYKDTDGAIVNTGYALITPSGSVSRFNEYEGKLTFVRSPVELVVTGTPWTVEDGRTFYQKLKTFGFDQPLSYYAVAGWCALAPFASFLFRRPHIWITAKRGMGKTFLIDNLISPVLGEEYVFYTDGSTEAGIRQSLYRDNRPVILDEFEANKKYDIDSLERILELSRSAYGGKKKVKGSQSQKAVSFTLKVMFCFASINVNISNDADRSRIAVCRMTESNGRMGMIDNPDGLRARIFLRLNEVNDSIRALHKHMEDLGYEDRTADTYSPLLVGLWMILSDVRFPATDADVAGLSADDKRLYDHILASLPQTAQTEEKRPDEERILEEIFQTRLKLEGGSEKTVAELLTTVDDMKRMVYDDVVQRYGIKRDTGRDGIEYLAVVHDSKELKAMLKDTPFGSSYKEVLKRNSAYMETRQIHVAKQQMSCIVLRWKDIEERYFKEKEETDIVPF